MADISAPGCLLNPGVPLHDLITVFRRIHGPPFSLQMCFTNLKAKLKLLIGIIPNHQIPMRICAGRTASKGLCTVNIRKYIMGMPVTLHHRQRRMECHPENQVGQLAQSPANVTADMSQKQHHSLPVSLSSGGLSDELPIAEGLTGADNNTVQTRRCQFQINDLILLPLHLVAA